MYHMSHVTYMIHVQMNIFEQGWMRLCNTRSIDIDPRSLVK